MKHFNESQIVLTRKAVDAIRCKAKGAGGLGCARLPKKFGEAQVGDTHYIQKFDITVLVMSVHGVSLVVGNGGMQK